MAYRHLALSGPERTRLLILHPAIVTIEPLHGSLVECVVGKSYGESASEISTRYEALSYVWGPPSTVHGINIDSSTLPITANCDAALRQLRRTSTDRVVWVDSICIDQTPEGVQERSSQVAIMGSIYETAADVLIWLGEGDAKTDALFLHLKGLYELRDDSLEDSRAELNVEFMNECDTKWPKTEDAPVIRQIIEDVLSRPWFERMWTLQELLLASHATALCGSKSMEWDAFCEAMTLIEASFAPSSKGSRNFINCYYARSDFKELISENTDIQAMPSGAGGKDAAGENRKDLSTIIYHTRIRHATDPKDKIFALYGVSQKLGKTLPIPDYTASIPIVYAKATAEIMRQDNSLWSLDNVWSKYRRQDLPSWVPDWSDDPRWSEDLLSELGCLPVNHGDRESVNHWDGPVEDHTPNIIVSSDCTQLTLVGLTYGMIDTVFDDREIAKTQHDIITMPRLSIEQALAMRMHGAEQLRFFRGIYDSLGVGNDSQLHLETFCRLLLTYSPTQPLRSFEIGSKDLHSLLTASEETECREVIIRHAKEKLAKAVDSNQRHDAILRLVESDIDTALDVLLSINLDCGPYEIYGQVGNPGHKIVHLVASATGFYNIIRGLAINRSIFTTSNGLIGYAYGSVRIGDNVVKFQGATSPHVLRAYGPDHYQLLSSAVTKASRDMSALVKGQDRADFVLI